MVFPVSSRIGFHVRATAQFGHHICCINFSVQISHKLCIMQASRPQMKLIKNTGNDRVMDALRSGLSATSKLDIATPAFSVFAFAEFASQLQCLSACRLVLPDSSQTDFKLLGADADRVFRNQLNARWLARQCADWISNRVEVRNTQTALPQSSLIATDAALSRAITGHCPFTTDGLGLTPSNPFSLIQCSETLDECATLQTWFTKLWDSLPASPVAKQNLLAQLATVTEHKAPALAYYLILYHLFKDLGDTLDEEQIVKSATGIRNTVVWKKLFKFQRDGVVGAIDKLARLGGCIIADSVGLGKTFEALAIIKYHELRNDRVLVLVPKRLRDNWTLYKANDRRNILASDRFNYDVLNHTDLSRDGGCPATSIWPRQLGQLRPRRHRRIAQLSQQGDAQ
jgi:hypothetical protein